MNNSDDALGFVVLILIIAVVLAFILAQWAIILIVGIITGIVLLIKSSAEKKEKEDTIKNINEEIIKNVKFKHKVKDTEIIKELGLFDKRVYDSMFEPQIRKRGETYCLENKIEDLKKEDNKYSCRINGTKEYNVSILFDKDKIDDIAEATCECPYYLDEHKNCKHIYALLYKIKCGNNIKLLEDEIINVSDAIGNISSEMAQYIEKNRKDLGDVEHISAVIKFNIASNKFFEMKKYFGKTRVEEDLFEMLKSLIEILLEHKENYEELINSRRTSIQKAVNNLKNNGQNNDDIIINVEFETEEERKKQKTNDKEVVNSGLDENEIKHVKEDGYDVWNFDEEELEEDDFYYDDDDFHSGDDE